MKRELLIFFMLILSPAVLYAHGEMKHLELGENILRAEKKGVKVRGWIDNREKSLSGAVKDPDRQGETDKMTPLLTYRTTFWIGKSPSSGAIKRVYLKIASEDTPREETLASFQGHYIADLTLRETGRYEMALVVETARGGNVEFSFEPFRNFRWLTE